jgi:hypothetical protein
MYCGVMQCTATNVLYEDIKVASIHPPTLALNGVVAVGGHVVQGNQRW